MLVLSRKCNESIIIGDDIMVTIVDVRGDKVRVGVEAPQTVSVHRHEVYNAIHKTTSQILRASMPPEYANVGAEMAALEKAAASVGAFVEGAAQ